jgi:hypothetical protein
MHNQYAVLKNPQGLFCIIFLHLVHVVVQYHMFLNFLANVTLQLIFFVGIISVLGLVIWQLNKRLFRLLGYKRGKKIFLSTGIIGVPIHEFGHAFFCVLFGHKIKEVKWFTPNSADGTLGYVRHSFNRKNIYHQIGNFFIGIGPLLLGSAAIILLMYMLLPNSGDIGRASRVTMSIGDGVGAGIAQYFEILWAVFLAIFHYTNLANFSWWVFIILACSIALHMDLSMADVKGMLRGLLYIVIIVCIMNLVLCLVKVSWARAVTGACLWLSVSVVSFMAIAILLLLILVLITAIARRVKRKVKAKMKTPKPKTPVIPTAQPATSIAEASE